MSIFSKKNLLCAFFLSLFLGNFMYAQTQTSAPVLNAAFFKTLKVAPSSDQKLYAKQDIKFEVTIPGISPAAVQIIYTPEKNGVSLKTARKIETYDEIPGTTVELWYSFDKTGTFKLPDLILGVKGWRRNIAFESVVITENPQKLLPRIVLTFENGTILKSDDALSSKPLFNGKIGEKIKFTVNIQYALQIVQFNWEIPKDSIFTQVRTYDITEVKYRERNYSDQLVPVADFEWTVLAAGDYTVPKIKLAATAYSGYRNELLLPQAFIRISSAQAGETVQKEDELFAAAFDEKYMDENEELQLEITDEICQKLAGLRSKERNSFFLNPSNRRNRSGLEQILGLPSTADEFSVGWFYVAVLILVLLVTALVFAIKNKKLVLEILIPVLMLCSTVFLGFTIVQKNKVYAVSLGCTIYSIPEENASASSEIAAGNRVRVAEKAGEWFYVQAGQSGGWCKDGQIILIK